MRARQFDPLSQKLLHARAQLYNKHRDDPEFIKLHFPSREVEKLKKYLAQEKAVEEDCIRFGYQYDPPSDEFDRIRLARMKNKIKYQKRKKK